MATKLGSFITKKREAMGLSVRDLAKKLPVGESTVGDIENGDIETPSKPVIRALARALNVSESHLSGLLPPGAEPMDKISHNPGESVHTVRKQGNCKTEGGVCYPASDYACVPDRNTPSDWQLRMTRGSPGNFSVAQLGQAAAALGKGFRGNKVKLKCASGPVKAKIRAKYKSLGVKEVPDSVKELKNQITFWENKETGRWHWAAVYSNNYRDKEKEIISAQSHENFVKEVDAGNLPHPELWLWHIPYKWGEGNWVAFTKEGFALAAGTVDEGKEHIAQKLSQMEDLAVSHGMPRKSIKRDPEDQSIILSHQTREVSPLPSTAAANHLTSFILTKEGDSMSIPENKKPFLKDAGLSDEDISDLEGSVQKKAIQAEEEGLEQKEAEQPKETKEETQVPEDVTKAFQLLIKGFQALQEEVAQLKESYDALQESEEARIIKQANGVPKDSLEALVQEGIFSKETQIGKDSPLATKGATEKEAEQPGVFFEEWLK